MRYTLILFIFSLASLNCTAQTASQTQDVAAQKETPDINPDPNEPPKGAVNEKDTSTNNPAKNQEENTPKSNNSGHRFSLFGMVVSDLIALTLGTLAIVISILGLRQNRLSNEKQNRAYVSIGSCTVEPIRENDEFIGYKIKIEFINKGATPANKLTSDIWISMTTDYEAAITSDANPIPINSIYLAPSDYKWCEVTVKHEAFKAAQQSLATGQLTLKLMGAATYEDQFGIKQTLTFKFKRNAKVQDGFFGQLVVADEGLTST